MKIDTFSFNMRYHRSFLVFVTIIFPMFASAQDNKDMGDFDLMYEKKLMSDFGCDPQDEWKLLKHNSKNDFIRDVCILRSYQVNEAPKAGHPNPIALFFSKVEVLSIDERKKSISLMIGITIFWEDSRIKAKASKLIPPIQLPAIEKTEQSSEVVESSETVNDPSISSDLPDESIEDEEPAAKKKRGDRGSKRKTKVEERAVKA